MKHALPVSMIPEKHALPVSMMLDKHAVPVSMILEKHALPVSMILVEACITGANCNFDAMCFRGQQKPKNFVNQPHCH